MTILYTIISLVFSSLFLFSFDREVTEKTMNFLSLNIALSSGKPDVFDQNTVPSGSHIIEFEKFSVEEVAKFAAYYKEFSGFKSEIVLSQSPSYTKLIYNSEASKETILKNLRKTAEINGFNVLIRNVENNIHIRLLSKTTNSLDYGEW